jgi:hypothetical protein
VTRQGCSCPLGSGAPDAQEEGVGEAGYTARSRLGRGGWVVRALSASREQAVAPVRPSSEKHCPFPARPFRSRFMERSHGRAGTGRFPSLVAGFRERGGRI